MEAIGTLPFSQRVKVYGDRHFSGANVPPPALPTPRDELRRLLAEGSRLRAEGRRIRVNTKRLRLDCVKARLDLAERLATSADPKVHGEKLATVFQSKALTAFTNIRDAISDPGWTLMERQALRSRLNRLQWLLTDLRILQGGRKKAASGVDDGAEAVAVPTLSRKSPNHTTNGHDHNGLTTRELEVLKCIAEGHATKETASILGIAFKTAACHRSHIMDKLGIHTTVGLVRYAIRTGLVEV